MTKINEAWSTTRPIDKSYEIYLALYQAITGTEDKEPIYNKFSPDFFDLIVDRRVPPRQRRGGLRVARGPRLLRLGHPARA